VDGRRYTELHVDGGVSATLLLQPALQCLERAGHQRGESADCIYVIIAGKLRLTPRLVPRRLFSVASESIRGALQAQFEAELLNAYLLTRLAGAEFALAAVPDDFPADDSLAFEPQVLSKLFDQGFRDGAHTLDRHSLPPGLIKLADHAPPRAGVSFTVQEPRPATPSAEAPSAGSAAAQRTSAELPDVMGPAARR
jgi:hypothetical protein